MIAYPRGQSSEHSASDRRADLDRFGSYVVIEKIASGGMADIYKAHPEGRAREVVALKRIRPDCDDHPEFRKMLLDEAQIASRLDHPNISRVVGVEECGDQVGLLLEYVDGLDLGRLKRVARDRAAITLESAIHVVREVLEALDFAHNAKDENGAYLNVVHRDISPGNVMVDVSGRVRLVDFGIARAQNRLAKTEAGNVKGKFRYMAPEQIKGFGVGPSSDVYSTAILLWELLTRRRIYDDASVGQLMLKVANAEIPSLREIRPDLSKALAAVFAKATALEPQDRYASARAFADALDSVLYEYDPARCRRQLADLVRLARASDRQKGLERALVRARFAAEREVALLEEALLRALESPDRVERVSIDWERLHTAEHGVSTTFGSMEISEPPTHPMARALPGDWMPA